MTDIQMHIFELGSKGYTCAQILMQSALALQGEENKNLVRSMSALAQGIANTGNTCGALTGGLCMLSLYSAKGDDFEQSDPKEALMWEELIEWFNQEIANGNNSCDSILGICHHSDSSGHKEDVDNRLAIGGSKCANIIAKVWEKTLQILQSYDINPSIERQID